MIQVALLTTEEANQLKGVEIVKDNYFNPIQDKNGNWIISLEEVEQSTIEWLKDLPIIDYQPIKDVFKL
jgi:hypothetical protein